MKKDVGYLIKSINDKIKTKTDIKFKQYNLTMSQSRVLAFLSDNNGQATQKEIEVFLDVSHPTIVGIVSRMEQNGYVSCSTCKDNKNKNVTLTNKAKIIDKDMKNDISETEKLLLKPLSFEEREQLTKLLQAIDNHLK